MNDSTACEQHKHCVPLPRQWPLAAGAAAVANKNQVTHLRDCFSKPMDGVRQLKGPSSGNALDAIHLQVDSWTTRRLTELRRLASQTLRSASSALLIVEAFFFEIVDLTSMTRVSSPRLYSTIIIIIS